MKYKKGGGGGGCHGRDQENCLADNKHYLTDYEGKALSLMNICDSDDGKDGRDGDDDNVFVIIDIIQVAQKQKELQARFKELEKQEQV